MDLADYANISPPSAAISAITSYIEETDNVTPIDHYRRTVRRLLNYGTSDLLDGNDFIGRLLLIGLVSAAEGYVRTALSSCMEVCPLAQTNAATKTINLGGLLWHGRDGFSKSAFEHASFASKEELTKACSGYLGFKLEDNKFKSLLDEFDSVCQLRHGIVHADGFLPGRNAVQLGIPKAQKTAVIVVRYKQLQEVAAVINTLIYTLNRELFAEMCKRWAIDWRKRADWIPGEEKARFTQLWRIFHSGDERALRKGKSKITLQRCLAETKSLYGI